MSEYNIVKLLDDRGIKYNNAGVQNVKIKCFSGSHEDKRPSLLINISTGEYHCFVCHAKGNIVSYFLDNKEITYADALFYQKTNLEHKDNKSENEILESLKKRVSRAKEFNEITVEELPTKVIKYNQYLQNRGITTEDIKEWNIQLVCDPESIYNGWIYIPIYFQGRLRTYFLRSTKTKHKIYGYKFNEKLQKNEGYPRRDILFGFDKVKDFNKPIYLFEGIFDKIWFEKTNNQTLSLLGNVITKEHIKLLKNCKELILGLDNDEASLHIVRSAIQLLSYDINIKVWRPPLGKKDANECTLRELIEQTYKEVPLFDFIKSDEYEKWSIKNATTKSGVNNS